MVWHITDSADEFLAGAGDFLHARPVANTLLLTVTKTLRRRGSHAFGDGTPVFGWCGEGAFLRTPPRAALLTDMPPAAAAELAISLAGTDLPGVGGPEAVAEAFAAEWHRLTGATPRVTARHRLYRLDKLIPPDPPPAGAVRVAGASDRDLLVDWMAAFQAELGEDPGSAAELVDDKLSHGGLMLWADSEGWPVSMAGITRMEAGMVRVQCVYTPAEHRAKGYAGGVTVAVTCAALDAGATDVVLFTDLTNPTSNALYQRLGYSPIEDRRTVEFS
jgi:RimJ/RimL family protein N-acetyltransferase